MPAQADNWHRDELVLVLNLYRQLKGPPSSSDLAKLSSELKAHAETELGEQPADARSTSAISMMVGRFKALETGIPSSRGISTATETVWNEFGRSAKQNAKQIWDAAAEVRGRWATEAPSS